MPSRNEINPLIPHAAIVTQAPTSPNTPCANDRELHERKLQIENCNLHELDYTH